MPIKSLLNFSAGATAASKASGRLGPLPLRVNFAWTLIGNVVYAACQWGMLSALAKLGTPEMVGQFALGLAITAPIVLFSNLALRAVQATDARRAYQFGEYLALRLATTALALMIIGGIAIWGGYRPQTAWVIVTIGLAKAFESISDVFYGLFQQHERLDRISRSLMLRGCLSLPLLALGVYFTRSAVGGAWGLAVAWALVLVMYDIPGAAWVTNAPSRFSVWRPLWSRQRLLDLAKVTLPLGFTMMLISLNTNIPRYFVQRYGGERELGFFAAMAYLMVAGTTVVNALGQSASPRLANYFARGDITSFRGLLLKLMGIGAVLGMGGVLLSLIAGREILTWLYRQEYAAFVDAFVWLTVAAGVSYIASFLGYGMTAAHYYRVQPLILICTTAASLALCYFLVPAYGILGASWAIGLSALVQAFFATGCIVHATLRVVRGTKPGGRPDLAEAFPAEAGPPVRFVPEIRVRSGGEDGDMARARTPFGTPDHGATNF